MTIFKILRHRAESCENRPWNPKIVRQESDAAVHTRPARVCTARCTTTTLELGKELCIGLYTRQVDCAQAYTGPSSADNQQQHSSRATAISLVTVRFSRAV